MSKRPTQADINFLFEMGNIRFIDRMWKRFLNSDFANLAEHHFRMFWIAMIIAGYEGGDTGKIAKLVLLHDIAESRTGDVDYLARQYVERNEELGIKDMLGNTAIEKEFLELWHEYEAKKSLESQITKDADNLDVDFELMEQSYRGDKLPAHWASNRRYVSEEKLYTKTAKLIWDQLQKSNPHDWHTTSRNRRNAGDWQSKTES